MPQVPRFWRSFAAELPKHASLSFGHFGCGALFVFSCGRADARCRWFLRYGCGSFAGVSFRHSPNPPGFFFSRLLLLGTPGHQLDLAIPGSRPKLVEMAVDTMYIKLFVECARYPRPPQKWTVRSVQRLSWQGPVQVPATLTVAGRALAHGSLVVPR